MRWCYLTSEPDLETAKRNWIKWQREAMRLRAQLESARKTLAAVDNPHRAAYLTPAILVDQLRKHLDAPTASFEPVDISSLARVREAWHRYLEARERLFPGAELFGALLQIHEAVDALPEEPLG